MPIEIIIQTKWKHSSRKSPLGNYAGWKYHHKTKHRWLYKVLQRPFKNRNSKFIHLPNPVLTTTFVHDKTVKVNPFRAATLLESLPTILTEEPNSSWHRHKARSHPPHTAQSCLYENVSVRAHTPWQKRLCLCESDGMPVQQRAISPGHRWTAGKASLF